MIDWDDPVARLRLIESIGVDAYNAAMKEHLRTSVIKTVNGHDIRPVQTRFGRLFMVADTDRAFATLDEAEAFAKEIK